MKTFKAYNNKTFDQKDKIAFTFKQLLSTIENTFADLISNNIGSFSESLPNDTAHFFRVHTKQ